MNLFISKTELLTNIKTILDRDNHLEHKSIAYDSFSDCETNDEIWETFEQFMTEPRIYKDLFTPSDNGITLHITKDIHKWALSLMHRSNIVTFLYDKLQFTDWATTHWNNLNLGGDDDVDYNGTYLDLVLEAITKTIYEKLDYNDHYIQGVITATWHPIATEYYNESHIIKLITQWANL